MAKLKLLCVMWCVFFGWCSAAPSERTVLPAADQQTANTSDHQGHQNDTLLEELDSQENILTQLLGDYDKVKALSEGSDCRCKCVVRPMSRSACRRIEEGSATSQDFYTVETITSGPNCKCACIAPPSAVNPCEGDFRLKKLREAGKDNVKLSTIIELLEGSFYGMDLLKLHSITSKLLDRVENIEKTVSKEQSQDETEPQASPPARLQMTDSPAVPSLPPRQGMWKNLSELSDRAAAYQNKEEKYDEMFVGSLGPSRDFSEGPKPTTGVSPQASVQERARLDPQGVKTGPNGMTIRGVTYYKSDHMVADDGEPGENYFEYDGFSGDGPVNLFIEEQLLQHRSTPSRARERAGPRAAKPKAIEPKGDARKTSQSKQPIPAQPATTNPSVTTPSVARATKWPIPMMVRPAKTPARQTIDRPLTTVASMATLVPGITQESPGNIEVNPTLTATNSIPSTPGTTPTTAGVTTFGHATQASTTSVPVTPIMTLFTEAVTTTTAPAPTPSGLTMSPSTQKLPPTTPSSSAPRPPSTISTTTTTTTTSQTASVKRKYSISWDEEDVEVPPETVEPVEPGQNHEERPTRKPGECKDTLATISEPVTHNNYGRNEGAWMKDPLGNDDRIYVTNYYYGNNLLEFRNMEVFKQGRFTNSYKLPYNWIGTGHVVYDGAFYYNRAFSRDIIKFDLRLRYVAAWTMLHDAVFEETESPWQWRGHSDIDFAVDESGLWVIYPALDDDGFLQEVIVLTRMNPLDLSVQRETTWRTGLRRNRYGNCFIVCGVLYAVDSYNRKDANLSYAFDTHTNTQMIPRMPFTNNYTYTTQVDYNPKEGMLYAWDNGHQVTYDVKFAYADTLQEGG
ncbi:olfactomedin-like 2Ba isoform X1 [Hypomesus transpacificus]|uniref:olfactomedin-like 2Ba isoform X1 n=1 Tax=Hypomesus transpacificus TaxID=137520 RepID=UPI001F07E4EF|nr:olfactomedin-like 2Ba isoform X1 [Hypomesus transpacificus]